MGELIEMPFGLRPGVCPRNHVLDGYRSPWEGAIFRVKVQPIVKYRDAVQ